MTGSAPNPEADAVAWGELLAGSYREIGDRAMRDLPIYNDALGVEAQVNLPGTTDEYPNWRHRLPVALETLADHPGFSAHAGAMRAARPK